MKSPFLRGCLLGSIVTAAILAGFAHGYDLDFDQETNAAACRVRISGVRANPGTQCLFDQVMVGVRNDALLCADLTVTCP